MTWTPLVYHRRLVQQRGAGATRSLEHALYGRLVALVGVLAIGCSPAPPTATSTPAVARNLVLVTIDTLRADRIGAYGLTGARTPVMDGLAREGVRFSHAYATAPITLTSHASMLTGRYPAGHGAHHNGMAMTDDVPTLATALKAAGFATGAFVSAFPLDRRFGLAHAFDEYDDRLGRGPGGRLLNERPGDETVARAIAWLDAHRSQQFFLWLHLFEPHAPYGAPAASTRRGASSDRPAMDQSADALARYDAEVATGDALTGRLLAALGDTASSTLVIVTADHGEAFGEHGEIGHSIFVYDTTLRIPLIVRGPGVPRGRALDTPVSVVDIAPTTLALLGQGAMDTDGVSLAPLFEGKPIGDRAIYAESVAPLLDFGWSPLRTVRDQGWKFIDAPKPELFDLGVDAAEQRNLVDADPQRAARMRARINTFGEPLRLADPLARSGQAPRQRSGQAPAADAEARRRLDALGYVSGAGPSERNTRADPKDRIQVASRLASVMAGEVQGAALVSTLEGVLKDEPGNPQAHLRLAYAYLESNRCDVAVPHLRAALAARLPSADAGLGLAGCLLDAGDVRGALAALGEADALEPGNPVVEANRGLIALQQKDAATAVARLTSALSIDPGLLEARFALARALAHLGRRADAAREARTLLDQLPPDAPQRAEVERLIAVLK